MCKRVFEQMARLYQDCLVPPERDRKRPIHTETGKYPFISCNLDALRTTLEFTLRLWPTPKSYLDVGCGIGNTLIMANFMGLRVAGIELDPRYFRVAERIIKELKHRTYSTSYVYNMDAFHFHAYDNYDIIHFYTPMRDTIKELQLEEMIAKRAKKGAFIIPSAQWYLSPKTLDALGIKLVAQVAWQVACAVWRKE